MEDTSSCFKKTIFCGEISKKLFEKEKRIGEFRSPYVYGLPFFIGVIYWSWFSQWESVKLWMRIFWLKIIPGNYSLALLRQIMTLRQRFRRNIFPALYAYAQFAIHKFIDFPLFGSLHLKYPLGKDGYKGPHN